MRDFKKVLTFMSLVVFVLSLSTGSASGKVLFNDTIAEGDGYQINDFVIDVAEVFPNYDSVTLHIFEGKSKDPVHDKLISVGSSFKFTIEGETVEITAQSVHTGIVPRASLLITISDGKFINSKTTGVVKGGHKEAVFAGTPVLEIIKTAEPENVNVGDMVTVKVTVRNTGDDKATKVIFSDPTPARFILQQTLISPIGQMTIESGETRLIYTYTLKATEPGIFVIDPATAIYSNNLGSELPQAISNAPSIAVEGSSKKANLEVQATFDKYTVDRRGDLQGTVKIKNSGGSSASGVKIALQVPAGLKYSSGDKNIEMLSGVPTIYLESFGVQQEKEIPFSIKAIDKGTYTITAQYSYNFNDGIDPTIQTVSSTYVTKEIFVKEGKYDYLLEQPLYVYLVPLLVIGVIAGWLFYRHRQYKF